MYQRNETHAFVEKYFVEADHKYLRQTAHEIDASALEKR